MNDQNAKRDEGKLRLSLVPMEIVEAIAVVREYGNEKYHEVDNWKTVEPERYVDAAFRHFVAYLREPYGKDAESSIPHLYHLACNIAFLCSLEISRGTVPPPQDVQMTRRHPGDIAEKPFTFVRGEK